MLRHASIQYLKLKRKVKGSARHNANIALHVSLTGHSAGFLCEEQTIHLLKFSAARYRPGADHPPNKRLVPFEKVKWPLLNLIDYRT
jgi:hypothetical protein